MQQNMASADCPVSRPGERHQFSRASRRCQPTARPAPVWGAPSAASLAAAAAAPAVAASLQLALLQYGELLQPPL